MFLGSTFVIISCLVWGLIFVVPLFMTEFSSWDITLGRYFFYGLISWVMIGCKGFKPLRFLNLPVIKTALLFSFMTNLLCYFLLVIALRYSNPAVAALILGLTPISVAFYGNWCQRQYSLSKLAIPSCVIALGLILVNIPAFDWSPHNHLAAYCIGLLCACISLAIWTWFVEANARFLKENSHIPPSDWTAILGGTTLFWVLLLGLGTFFYTESEEFASKFFVWSDTLKIFIIGSVVLGIVCAWLGSLFWNFASKHLHLSLAGQLMIFETIFGLTYVYRLKSSLPQPIEAAGITLMIVGVTLSLFLLKQPSTLVSPVPEGNL